METVDKPRWAEVLAEAGGKIKTVLGIFAKEPVEGQVKTRLSPPLSAGEATALYRSFLEETVAAMSGGDFALVLCYAGSEAFFRDAFPGVPLLPQGEGDLGQRMERTLCTLLADGFEAAALIGSDTPDLPLSLVEEAFSALRANDVVTSPSRDGGYVLVGERRHRPELFQEIPWSTAGVLTATRQRATELAVDYREVGGWEDVDDPVSLRRLVERSPGSAAARLAVQILARHGLQGRDSNPPPMPATPYPD